MLCVMKSKFLSLRLVSKIVFLFRPKGGNFLEVVFAARRAAKIFGVDMGVDMGPRGFWGVDIGQGWI